MFNKNNAIAVLILKIAGFSFNFSAYVIRDSHWFPETETLILIFFCKNVFNQW